jgi:hypothetical protein
MGKASESVRLVVDQGTSNVGVRGGQTAMLAAVEAVEEV